MIIETDTVCLESDKINLILQEEMEPIKSYDTGLMYILQKYCPAIKALYKQISDWRNADMMGSTGTTDISVASYEEYVEFVRKLKKDGGNNVTLIIFYQPAYSIDASGGLAFEESVEWVDYFAQACQENDVVFINMTEKFCELYEQDNILAHGFSNTAIGIGHLNRYGHEAISDVLVEYIEEDMQ